MPTFTAQQMADNIQEAIYAIVAGRNEKYEFHGVEYTKLNLDALQRLHDRWSQQASRESGGNRPLQVLGSVRRRAI